MQKEKFKAINLIWELIVRIDTNLENFPKKYIEIKNRIRNSTYDLLEIAYTANTESNVDKKRDLIEIAIAKIKVIDFLINLSFDKKIITEKKYLKLGEAMDEIIKYLVGWKKSINKGMVDGVWAVVTLLFYHLACLALC